MRTLRYELKNGIIAVDDPGSSSGRTPGFDPGSRGSNPCPGTKGI